ncbi:cell division protein FtsQ [Isoptericola halotolerans]|uniref:cell division protein FtsQ n=1 Tax=Isoptericola halotolerans TaxID=300560 RepID=UPI00388D832E
MPSNVAATVDKVRGTLPRSEQLSGPQKLMILVLSMTLYGVGDIVANVVPEVQVGPLELGVSYFAFIAVVLAALLSPLWVALGAPLGELVFSDMLLGDFGGLSEIEGFLQTALAIYVAGCLVRNPLNRVQVALAPIVMVLVDKVSGGIVDILKVVIGIDPEALEEADGLLGAFLLAEGLDIVVTVVFSGILFGALPALWLTPRLYGKIEPIMGLRPRDPEHPPRLTGPAGMRFWPIAVLAVLAAGAIALFATWEEFVGREDGLSTLGAFEPDFVDRFGEAWMWVAGAVALTVGFGVFVVVAVLRSRRARAAGTPASTSAEDDEASF